MFFSLSAYQALPSLAGTMSGGGRPAGTSLHSHELTMGMICLRRSGQSPVVAWEAPAGSEEATKEDSELRACQGLAWPGPSLLRLKSKERSGVTTVYGERILGQAGVRVVSSDGFALTCSYSTGDRLDFMLVVWAEAPRFEQCCNCGRAKALNCARTARPGPAS